MKQRKRVIKPLIFEPKKIEPDEQFKIIDDNLVPNVEKGRYLISNKGRIYDRELERDKALSLNSSRNKPYYKTKLNYVDENDRVQQKDVYIHRAVATYFAETGFESRHVLEVDHIDGNHANNKIDNLQFVTSDENHRRAQLTNLIPKGEDRPDASLTNLQVSELCSRYMLGEKLSDLANKFGISYKTAHAIINGKNYKSITKNFNLPKPKEINNSQKENIVHEICRRLENGDAPTAIARDLGIGRYVVNDIKFGRNYKDISSQYNFKMDRMVSETVDDEMVHKICRELESGKFPTEVAKELNVNVNTVACIKNGKTHKDISSQYKFRDIKSTYISDNTARTVCALLQAGYTPSQISRMNEVGVTKSQAEGIKYRRSFTYISKDFKF